MSTFDLLILLILAASGAIGWHRGGVREVVTLAAIAAGFLAIGLFGRSAAAAMPGSLGGIGVLVLIFIVADAAVTLLGAYLVRRFFGAEKQRSDRAAGALFGVLRGWVLGALVLFTVDVYHVDTDLPPSVERSLTAAPLRATAHGLLRKADIAVTELFEHEVPHISGATVARET